ncbi:unnamed protein product (macronuclear) [Paramecium tetraurelia]|uniref:BZIP domain-containing protein n=1 Tax=Paramecium tetraurelia TaxID=5888 RepID=A0CLF8_PARTE|nr:uncharacterized protein GSPATT00008173001 [Paramecium tetraurelia]CAK71625.1 unnamed protein product [Paramecium tetraurelia]|eukprot:XP_001439022.1 hypothetical protein (macronuclear) [Paramecium tetraurelia strain d4-2]
MNFIDSEEYDIPMECDDLLFQSNIFNNLPTPEHSKSTEDLEQKFKEERKQRILKKRIEKKQKMKAEAIQTMSKEELRKLRNRNSAQLSRDKKKIVFDNLVQENKNYSILLKKKDEQIESLQIENNHLRLRVRYLEENNQPINSTQSVQGEEEIEQISRANVITKSKMMNYGLLSLLAITCILSIINNDYQYNPKPIALSQLSNQRYDFLAPKYSQRNQTALFSDESNFVIPAHTFQNQTLFYNCTGKDKECQNFLNIVKAENADNIYFVNDETDHVPASRDHNFEMGEDVYLMKIKQDDEDNFVIFRARCQITENNSLALQRNTYEAYNNSHQY